MLTIINGILKWYALYQILVRGPLRVPFNIALGIILVVASRQICYSEKHLPENIARAFYDN